MNPSETTRPVAKLSFPGTAGGHSPAQAMGTPGGRPRGRRGVTLIELMVALAITMTMMTAVITLFANVAGTVANSRALIEVSERLRTARNRLQLDLAGHTATTLPPLRPEDGDGYLEIIEGPNTDSGSYLPLASPILAQLGNVPNPLNGTATTYSSAGLTANDIMGDADDVLMLTVRSQGEPFVGWGGTGYLTESNTAEVIWYAVPNGRSLPGDPSSNSAAIQLYTLYRRVLLVAPTLVPVAAFSATPNPQSIAKFYNNYDLSVRTSTSGNAVGNSLSDLTARENRFLHAFQVSTTASNLPTTTIASLSGWPLNAYNMWTAASPPQLVTPSSFPFALQNPSYMLNPNSAGVLLTSSLITIPAALTNTRLGEDVILTDVLSFDIRVFDPLAAQLAVSANDSTVVVPGDPGYYAAATLATPIRAGYGAYVDLGSNLDYNGWVGNNATTYFSTIPNAAYGATNAIANFQQAVNLLPQTYDTWSLGYEQNGVDEDGDGVNDEGTDGLDDDPNYKSTPTLLNGIVDDPPQVNASLPTASAAWTAQLSSVGERETLSPYPFPLRGVQITLRVYEADTQQVRQMTVVQDFLPD
ncbi:MAG TPA: prepilin-type N-terminal cleavage/methylation domain-containing protein [Pirellulales bacterium]|nr:prepilin-type N-terminal cleavage/methylation domain-containing protein [Pirellulales bacterium]